MKQNEFDTIKMIFDLDACQMPDPGIVGVYYHSRPSQAGYNILACKPSLLGCFGFNYIKVNEVERTIFIEISSKILAEHYAEGIHYGNFMNAIGVINRSGLIFIPLEALKAAECVWLDVKVDKVLPRPVSEANRILRAIHVPNKYRVASIGRIGKRSMQTLYFESNTVSSDPNYIFRIYDKGAEIRLKKHENFLHSLKEKASDVTTALAGMTRLERSYKTKAAIRTGFGLDKSEKTLLLTILQSKANPMLKSWDCIVKDFGEAQPLTIENLPFDNMNIFKLFIQKLDVKDVGCFTDLVAYSFNMPNIELFILSKYPNKNTRSTKRKCYRAMISRWQQFQNNICSTDFSVFAEIAEALKMDHN
jgi:hypothetical protein